MRVDLQKTTLLFQKQFEQKKYDQRKRISL
jgi:hypothetical protein